MKTVKAARIHDYDGATAVRVVPLFYERDAHGLPTGWIARVRESMARLTPQYSADRAVREYTENYYLPAASAYFKRAKEGGLLPRACSTCSGLWRATGQACASARCKPRRTTGITSFNCGSILGDLPPDSMRVELYADAPAGCAPERHVMTRAGGPQGADGHFYSARVPSALPAADYTPRLVPHNTEALVPLEAAQILWQR